MEIPIIPKVTSLRIHSGNVVDWNRLQKSIIKEPTEELKECLTSSISSWLESNSHTLDNVQDAKKLKLSADLTSVKLNNKERDSYNITVKLFLNNCNEFTIRSAIGSVLEELETSHLETVLICLPDKLRNHDNLLKCWDVLEQMHKDLQVFSIGTVDLGQMELQTLYNAVNVKPSINQVNLASCCVMPQKLIDYANQHEIQLLTHGDPNIILDGGSLQNIIKTKFTSEDSKNWEPTWIARYSSLIKCRGIIAAKAYIVNAERSLY